MRKGRPAITPDRPVSVVPARVRGTRQRTFIQEVGYSLLRPRPTYETTLRRRKHPPWRRERCEPLTRTPLLDTSTLSGVMLSRSVLTPPVAAAPRAKAGASVRPIRKFGRPTCASRIRSAKSRRIDLLVKPPAPLTRGAVAQAARRAYPLARPFDGDA